MLDKKKKLKAKDIVPVVFSILKAIGIEQKRDSENWRTSTSKKVVVKIRQTIEWNEFKI